MNAHLKLTVCDNRLQQVLDSPECAAATRQERLSALEERKKWAAQLTAGNAVVFSVTTFEGARGKRSPILSFEYPRLEAVANFAGWVDEQEALIRDNIAADHDWEDNVFIYFARLDVPDSGSIAFITRDRGLPPDNRQSPPVRTR